MSRSKEKRSRPSGGRDGAHAIPLRKKILFGALFTVAGLLLVELVALALLHALGLTKKDEVAIWNPDDPERREVVMPGDVGREAVASLDETVKFNMFSNRTTRPDPRYMFRVRPGFDSDEKTRGAVNTEGFRGREFDFEDASSLRILLLGDSCPFGWEILDTRKTIAFVMEDFLERDLGPVQIFNLGQPGFSTYQASLVFEDWFDRVAPDYVIYYGGWNDLYPSAITDARLHSVLQWTMTPRAGFLRRSNIYRLMSASVTRMRWAKVKAEAQAQSRNAMSEARSRVPMDEGIAHLAAMEARARAAGCRFLIVLPPFSSERAPGTPDGFGRMMEYREKISAALGDRALLLRFGEMEYDQPDSPQYFLEIDAYHPNEKGAALLGWGMSRAVINLEGAKGGATP